MYQSTYDIVKLHQNPLNFLYSFAQKKTDWCILTDSPSKFMFADSTVPRPKMPIVGNYQYSSYRCPTCGKALYKTIFHDGNAPHLVFNDRIGSYIEPARIFTCFDCLNFFAVQKGHRLIEGSIIMTKFPESQAGVDLYNMWFEIFNTIGDINARRQE